MTDKISAALKRNYDASLHKLGLADKPAKIDNTQLLKDSGLSIVHINRRGEDGRSMTIAFKGTRNIVEMATAITHPDDTFCKKVGTKQAVEAFLVGKKVRIPVGNIWQGHMAAFVKTLFSPMV